MNVLGTIVFDLGRFGIQFVASPRHADGLLITGPVTENMRLALKSTCPSWGRVATRLNRSTSVRARVRSSSGISQ